MSDAVSAEEGRKVEEAGDTAATAMPLPLPLPTAAAETAEDDAEPEMVTQEELQRAVVVTGIPEADEISTNAALFEAFAAYGLLERVIVQSDECGQQHAILIYSSPESAIEAADATQCVVLGCAVAVIDAGSLPTQEAAGSSPAVAGAMAPHDDLAGIAVVDSWEAGDGSVSDEDEVPVVTLPPGIMAAVPADFCQAPAVAPCDAPATGATGAGEGAGAGVHVGAGDDQDDADDDDAGDAGGATAAVTATEPPTTAAATTATATAPSLATKALTNVLARGYVLGERGVARVLDLDENGRITSYVSVVIETAGMRIRQFDSTFSLTQRTTAAAGAAAQLASRTPGASLFSRWLRRAQQQALATLKITQEKVASVRQAAADAPET